MNPNSASIQMVGDWDKQIKMRLSDALRVSMDVFERTGEEALKHGIILMAKTAAAMTPKSKKNRRVQRNNAGAQFVEVFNQGSAKPNRIYKFQYQTKDRKWRLSGTWEDAKRIANQGLAKRSWMWGLGSLGASVASAPIHGTSKVTSLKSGPVRGYIKENRLSYISDIMPVGWEGAVESSVVNQIFGHARRKMAQYWKGGTWARDKQL